MKVLVAACAIFSLLQIVASEEPVEYAEEAANAPEHRNVEHVLSKREEEHGPLMKAILTQIDGDSTEEQKREKRTIKKKSCGGGCGGGGGSSISSSWSRSEAGSRSSTGKKR